MSAVLTVHLPLPGKPHSILDHRRTDGEGPGTQLELFGAASEPVVRRPSRGLEGLPSGVTGQALGLG